MFKKLREARTNSKNVFDFILKLLRMIHSSTFNFLITIFALIWILMVAVGSYYLNEKYCPGGDKIALSLVVTGSLGCFSALVSIIYVATFYFTRTPYTYSKIIEIGQYQNQDQGQIEVIQESEIDAKIVQNTDSELLKSKQEIETTFNINQLVEVVSEVQKSGDGENTQNISNIGNVPLSSPSEEIQDDKPSKTRKKSEKVVENLSQRSQKVNNVLNKIQNFLWSISGLVNLALFCSFITTCVFVYRLHGYVNHEDYTSTHYCNTILYGFAFWTLNFVFVMISMLLLITCCFCIFGCWFLQNCS